MTGFTAAIQAVFPQTQIQRCIIHQVRQSLSSGSEGICGGPDGDLPGADPRGAELKVLELGERWGQTYAVAVRS